MKGGTSYFIAETTVSGRGGNASGGNATADGPNSNNSSGGGYVGDGGGAGGHAPNYQGGGGAGGYGSRGGNGYDNNFLVGIAMAAVLAAAVTTHRPMEPALEAAQG